MITGPDMRPTCPSREIAAFHMYSAHTILPSPSWQNLSLEPEGTVDALSVTLFPGSTTSIVPGTLTERSALSENTLSPLSVCTRYPSKDVFSPRDSSITTNLMSSADAPWAVTVSPTSTLLTRILSGRRWINTLGLMKHLVQPSPMLSTWPSLANSLPLAVKVWE